MISGLVILAFAIVYAIVGNNFFGNNWSPQSAEEVLFDGIGILIASIGVALIELSSS